VYLCLNGFGYVEKAKESHLDISRTIGMPFYFSSDLSSGRRPTSKSEEKSKGIPIVLEIVTGVNTFHRV
jgi:hypothetical protein